MIIRIETRRLKWTVHITVISFSQNGIYQTREATHLSPKENKSG